MDSNNRLIKLIAIFFILPIVCFLTIFHLKSSNEFALLVSDLPHEMRAVVMFNQGEKRSIDIKKLSLPILTSDTVLVKIAFAGIGSLQFHEKKKETFIPCQEFSGTIIAVGGAVRGFNVGDEVFGFSKDGGACAEYILADQDSIQFKPSSINMDYAATMPLASICSSEIKNNLNDVKNKTIGVFNANTDFGANIVHLLKKQSDKIYGIDTRSSEHYIRSLGVKDFIADNKLSGKKYDKMFDYIFVADKDVDVKLLQNALNKSGKIINNCNLDKIIEKGDVSRSLVNGVSLASSGSMPGIFKVFPLTKTREAYLRTEKGNTVGRILIKIQDN